MIVGSWARRWFGFAGSHPVAIAIFTAIATPAIGYYTVVNMAVNGNMADMIRDDMPHRIVELEYRRSFPVLYENIVVVVDAPTPEQARTSALDLAERMREAPEYFHNVYLPRGGFFEKHGLLYMDTEELEDFADRMARVQPYLAGLAQDGTLRGLSMMLERGIAAARDDEVGAEELLPMVGRMTNAVRAQRAGENYRLSWAEVVAGGDMQGVSRRHHFSPRQSVVFAGSLRAHRVRHAADHRK